MGGGGCCFSFKHKKKPKTVKQLGVFCVDLYENKTHRILYVNGLSQTSDSLSWVKCRDLYLVVLLCLWNVIQMNSSKGSYKEVTLCEYVLPPGSLHTVGGPCSHLSQISFFHANRNLVSDNKLRQDAAVAMGVTCTGESSTVVPRRQVGSVGLWTLWHCLHCLMVVCVCVFECAFKCESVFTLQKTRHCVLFFQLSNLIFV